MKFCLESHVVADDSGSLKVPVRHSMDPGRLEPNDRNQMINADGRSHVKIHSTAEQHSSFPAINFPFEIPRCRK